MYAPEWQSVFPINSNQLVYAFQNLTIYKFTAVFWSNNAVVKIELDLGVGQGLS